MKIGILQCDSVLEPLQGEFGNYPQMIMALLRQVRPDLTFGVYDVQAGAWPQDLDECDAYISTGSRHSVNDALPWVEALAAFLRRLHTAQKKYIGLCFGHQMLARTFGGRVDRSERGWGVGVSFNQISRRQPWMEPYQAELDLVVSHQDQVTQLPDGAEVLAASQFCPAYMLQLGQHMLGIQGHPEFSRAYSAALIDSRRDRIPPNRVREAFASLTSPVDDLLLARWMLNFIEQNQPASSA